MTAEELVVLQRRHDILTRKLSVRIENALLRRLNGENDVWDSDFELLDISRSLQWTSEKLWRCKAKLLERILGGETVWDAATALELFGVDVANCLAFREYRKKEEVLQ